MGRDSQAVHVRIVSYREALTPLWYDLAQYIRASILAPSLPPGALATPLSKAKLLGVEIPEPAGSEDPIPSVEESDPCSVVPKSKKQLQKWREAYEIVEESREEYKVEFLDSLIKKGTGTVADFQDAVASQMNWTVSDRTLRKIIKAGDAGCLD
jgi:hypothetical protein